VVCLGAGSITNWAHALPDQLTALQPGSRRAAEPRGATVTPLRRA
jgi:UDP-N-acetylmuramate--alanine ligase